MGNAHVSKKIHLETPIDFVFERTMDHDAMNGSPRAGLGAVRGASHTLSGRTRDLRMGRRGFVDDPRAPQGHRRHEREPLVEIFLRADRTDVSFGLRRFDLPWAFVREVRRAFPNHGFHRRLVALTLERLRSHPLSSLPMFDW